MKLRGFQVRSKTDW